MSRLTRALLAVGTVAGTLAGGQVVDAVPTRAEAPTVATAQKGQPELSSAIDALLTDPRFDGATVSVVVRDATTGELLYERDSEQRLHPASNAKLFSSAAAMDMLGPGYRFETELLAADPVTGTALRSDLFLRGGGDPTTLAEDYRGLARQLRAAGVQVVKGDLVADDTLFDDVPLGRAWSWDDESAYYSAATSALTVAPDTDYDSGTVIVRTSPSDEGAEPSVVLQPETGVVDVVNEATTGPAGSPNSLSVERLHGTDTIRITGTIPAGGSSDQEWVAVSDPTTYAADVLARALDREGIRLKGEVREGSTPESAKVLATHASMTVEELLTPFMKLSNNMHAEALVKTLGVASGGSGSWSDGLDVVRSYLGSHGVETGSLRIADGSGLSRFNLVSADDVADFLVSVRSEPWFEAWYAALPVAGNPDRSIGGTLRNRMRNTAAANNLHGKTGSLTSVTALSGYVTNADGRELVFSMITNNYLSSPRSQEDALGVTLASWSEAEGADEPGANGRALRRTTVYGPEGVECSWVKAC